MFLSSILFNSAQLRESGGFHSTNQLFQDVLAEFQMAAKHGRVDVPAVKASFQIYDSQNTGATEIKMWYEDLV